MKLQLCASSRKCQTFRDIDCWTLSITGSSCWVLFMCVHVFVKDVAPREHRVVFMTFSFVYNYRETRNGAWRTLVTWDVTVKRGFRGWSNCKGNIFRLPRPNMESQSTTLKNMDIRVAFQFCPTNPIQDWGAFILPADTNAEVFRQISERFTADNIQVSKQFWQDHFRFLYIDLRNQTNSWGLTTTFTVKSVGKAKLISKRSDAVVNVSWDDIVYWYSTPAVDVIHTPKPSLHI